MATYTSHYNLKKPATSDKIRIADFNGNADTIDATMYDNATLIANLKSDIGIVENTNTASHNISAGQYVIWKGVLYTASSAISSGATLSNANLTAVSGGGLNALNGKIQPGSWVTLTTGIKYCKNANIVHVEFSGANETDLTNMQWTNLGTMPEGFRPSDIVSAVVGLTSSIAQFGLVRVGSGGIISVFQATGQTRKNVWGSISYPAT